MVVVVVGGSLSVVVVLFGCGAGRGGVLSAAGAEEHAASTRMEVMRATPAGRHRVGGDRKGTRVGGWAGSLPATVVHLGVVRTAEDDGPTRGDGREGGGPVKQVGGGPVDRGPPAPRIGHRTTTVG